jgi:cytochrome P450
MSATDAGATFWRPSYSDEPHPFLAENRVAEPLRRGVLEGVPVWLVSRYEDVRRLLADPSLSNDARNAGPAARAVPWVQADNPHPLIRHLVRVDPPEHTRLRKLLTSTFTARRVAGLRPGVEQTAGKLADRILPAGHADLMSEFALPLSFTVIADLLGVPATAREQFLHWAGVYVRDVTRRGEAVTQLAGYLGQLIARRRTLRPASDGGPVETEEGDLVDGLLAVRDEGGRLSHDELLSLVFLLLIAGSETTASLIGNGLLALMHDPAQFAALRADPARLGTAVEEFLRFDGPVKISPALRFTTADIEVAGTVIPAGETVVLFLSAANRDPARFPRPATLDIGRDSSGHLGFGHGAHYCLGAPLARIEAHAGFATLLTRFDNLALGPGDPVWRHSFQLHSLAALPVTFSPVPVAGR